MGVSTNFMVWHGVKIDWDEDLVAALDEMEDHPPFVLVDSMSAKYIVLGTKLYDSGDLRWDLEGGTGDVAINPESLSYLESSFRVSFAEKFPRFFHYVDGIQFDILCFTHYS
jgi:hypothetical protein